MSMLVCVCVCVCDNYDTETLYGHDYPCPQTVLDEKREGNPWTRLQQSLKCYRNWDWE